MRYLRRWDPFDNMTRLMRFSWPMLEEDWEEAEEAGLRFSVDMYEEGDNVVIKADLPGMAPEDVDVTVREESVSLQAKREEKVEEKKRDYLRRERRFGSFSRTLSLPATVVPDKAEAKFKDGTLILTMPKAKPEKGKEVKVEVKGKED